MPYDSPFSAIQAGQQPASPRLLLAESASVDATSGTRALGQFQFNAGNYTGVSFLFTTVLSVSLGSLTGAVYLYNVTDGEVVAGTLQSTSALTPTAQISGVLTVGAAAGNFKNTAKLYEVRLQVSGSLVTDIVSLGSATLVFS